MAKLKHEGDALVIEGEGHVDLGNLTPDLVSLLLKQMPGQECFLPDLLEIVSEEDRLRFREYCLTSHRFAQTYRGYEGRWAVCTPEKKWDLQALRVVWTAKIRTGLMQQVYRVASGDRFIRDTSGTVMTASEFRYRYSRSWDEDLKQHAESVTSSVDMAVMVMNSQFEARSIQVSTPKGFQTITLNGPQVLRSQEWLLPQGIEFVSDEVVEESK